MLQQLTGRLSILRALFVFCKHRHPTKALVFFHAIGNDKLFFAHSFGFQWPPYTPDTRFSRCHPTQQSSFKKNGFHSLKSIKDSLRRRQKFITTLCYKAQSDLYRWLCPSFRQYVCMSKIRVNSRTDIQSKDEQTEHERTYGVRTDIRSTDGHTDYRRTYGARTNIRSTNEHTEYERTYGVRSDIQSMDGHTEYGWTYGVRTDKRTDIRSTDGRIEGKKKFPLVTSRETYQNNKNNLIIYYKITL